MMKNVLFLLLMTISSFSLNAQTDSVYNLILVKKGLTLDQNDSLPLEWDNQGFYLARNCYINYILKDKPDLLAGRVTDIKKDSIFISNSFNKDAAYLQDLNYESKAYHYTQISKIALISDRALGLYEYRNLSGYQFIFVLEEKPKTLESQWVQIYNNYPDYFELVPLLSAQGFDLLYSDNGEIFYFSGTGLTRPDPKDIDIEQSSGYGISFTPTKFSRIYGLALGLKAKNIRNLQHNYKDLLHIYGLNLEINPFSIISIFHMRPLGPSVDSIQEYEDKFRPDARSWTYGLNVVPFSNISEQIVHGVNIVGLKNFVDEAHGVSITGLSSFSYKMNGLSIAGIYNSSIQTRGVQIGLVNKSKDLRGFQFGLWNINPKRSLPLINWQFKAKKKKKTEKKEPEN
ncbi:hypothetical protein PPO43_14165 [Saprospira sp. CCB-QB6]|uniref:LA_2272 family surface repeat-containing protein n=1 Tax=Saprospira sp. CCB-QB6 TaxID=3023936 RepID=UPI00234A91BB|nr:hypothetical protein [Saprospira sp. CCB-QB6]WCL81116.1 hypothetical protein PPO43_14165 [Saprospira sp. CCB-QB6]